MRHKCPAGTFGERPQLTSSRCSGRCERGHYCPAGSTSGATPHGSAAVTAGRETERAIPSHNRRPARRCPAGRYGGQAGLKAASCSGLCAAGHFCPEASTNPRQRQCGGQGELFCPAGSRAPRRVHAGYYSTCSNNNLAPPSSGGCTVRTREAQLECEAGTYCSDGLQHDCPAGRFGRRTGLKSSDCDGLCYRGFYCPPGSDSPTAHPCPAGTYGADRGHKDASCSGPCEAGYDCPAASVDQFGRRSDAGRSQAP